MRKVQSKPSERHQSTPHNNIQPGFYQENTQKKVEVRPIKVISEQKVKGVCQVCGECNYMTGDGSNEQCFNEKCKLYGVSGFSQSNNQPMGAYSGAVVGNANNNSNPYAIN